MTQPVTAPAGCLLVSGPILLAVLMNFALPRAPAAIGRSFIPSLLSNCEFCCSPWISAWSCFMWLMSTARYPTEPKIWSLLPLCGWAPNRFKGLHSPTALCFSSIFSLPTRLGTLEHMRLSSYLSLFNFPSNLPCDLRRGCLKYKTVEHFS